MHRRFICGDGSETGAPRLDSAFRVTGHTRDSDGRNASRDDARRSSPAGANCTHRRRSLRREYSGRDCGLSRGRLPAHSVIGVLGSSIAAACLKPAVALAALYISQSAHCRIRQHRPEQKTALTPNARTALLLYAIAGAIALGYEVVWTQVTVQFTSMRTFAFAIVLATYLSGLVFGSALYARFGGRVRDAWATFGILIAAAGFVALIEVALLGTWLAHLQSAVEHAFRLATGSELAAMCGRFLVASFGIVFVPTVLLGAAFPAALRCA